MNIYIYECNIVDIRLLDKCSNVLSTFQSRPISPLRPY